MKTCSPDFSMKSFEYKFTAINKSYDQKPIITDGRIHLIAARCSLLTGENGSGKTTLLKLLAGLERPTGDTQVKINGAYYPWRSGKSRLLKNIMYVHQQPYLFDGSVEKNLHYLVKVNRLSASRVIDAISWAGLEDIMQQDARTLSGGEKQRVALARAYLRMPDALLLDEPTANLDQASRSRSLQLLKKFKAMGVALVIATHDADLFHEIQDETLQIKHSRLTQLKLQSSPSVVTDIHHYQPRQTA